MNFDYTNDQKGWILTFASSITCVLGSLVICLDIIYRFFHPKSNFQLRESKSVLVASLSLSSGVLLFTSLYKLLPEALEYFEKAPNIGSERNANILLITTYIGGILICSTINAFIHMMTSKSVVHCAHEGEPHSNSAPDEEDRVEHDHDHDHGHSHSHPHSHSHSYHHHVEETTPLIATKNSDDPNGVHLSHTFIDITERRLRGRDSVGKCMGYSSVEECVYTKHKHHHHHDGSPAHGEFTNAVNTTPANSSLINASDDEQLTYEDEENDSHDERQHNDSDHHHHVSTRYTHLFSIGLQTALAISVHKIPEGFLMFATSHASPELGLSVFFALAVHNFCEGFTIAFPLYLAIGNRAWSIGAAFLLGGCSQPVGALLAWGFFKSQLSEDANLTFGLLVAITSGFLSIIGLQMYGASVTYGGKQSKTLAFAFLGISIIGFSYSLQ